MIRLTTPTKSQHQPKALWAGVDGRARSAIASFGLFHAITVPGKGLRSWAVCATHPVSRRMCLRMPLWRLSLGGILRLLQTTENDP